jgi:ribosomal protein L11 methyltransferase
LAVWLEIAVPLLPSGRADELSGEVAGLLCAELPDASAGVEVRDGEIVFWVPLERGEKALEEARRAATWLGASGQPVDPAGVVSRPAAPEEEWRDAWKRHFRTIRLTRQIVVVPSWDHFDPGPDDRVIHLDPGQAFGTGAHASTRLVLELLQRLADGGEAPTEVLDLGTGSGILALAAALLWPRCRALAVDIDPVAVAVAAENVVENLASDRIRTSTAPIEALSGQFDLVLANIQADVLIALASAITSRVAPGGHLVLSGLLTGQVDRVSERYRAAGLERRSVVPSPDDPAWSATLLRRGPGQ